MKRMPAVFVALFVAALLAACAGGPVRRVSEPAAAIQQLTVHANGNWTVALRIDNFSSIPMRFDAVELALTIDGVAAGTLRGNAVITIGPESADVASLPFSPSAAARLRIADALAARRSVAYTLAGRLDAVPEDGGMRSFDIDRESAMTPVPGLPGVLR
ncbi:MAG TPA: LEA type 2 family protein [Xanthomonadaceae bacterium]|nr:LEA type 2 family protein [Xanthomonadaceae bacterium]